MSNVGIVKLEKLKHRCNSTCLPINIWIFFTQWFYQLDKFHLSSETKSEDFS
uniref:Uncharacterized protein n=1 Tax=Tetranychus urticae TaxID=32264 RepID=T1K5B3_TETUR